MHDLSPFEGWERMRNNIIDVQPADVATVFQSMGNEYAHWYETIEIPSLGMTAKESVERCGLDPLLSYLKAKSEGAYE